MANNTKNYNLIKPTENEVADIVVINDNMDIIDQQMKPVNALNSSDGTKALSAAQGRVLDGKISEVNIGKVDKIAGKGLSTNDYTTAEKTKLAGIATGANKTVVANNLTTATAGSALDAVQGKVLDGKISEVNSSLSAEITERKSTMWNPNLLHNWNFRNPVNQRGFLTITNEAVYKYFIDRWYAGQNSKYELIPEGIKLTGMPNADCWQYFEADLTGHEWTVSIEVDGKILSNTGKINTTADTISILGGNIYAKIQYIGVDKNMWTILFGVINSAVATFSRVKLEHGTISTLANDPPQDYGTELAKCQRYLVELNPYNTVFATVGRGKVIGFGGRGAEIHVGVPRQLRIHAATAIMRGDWCLQAIQGIRIPVTSINVNSMATSGTTICLTCHVENTLVIDSAEYELLSADGEDASILISAEL